jgi:hypothetical protein
MITLISASLATVRMVAFRRRLCCDGLLLFVGTRLSVAIRIIPAASQDGGLLLTRCGRSPMSAIRQSNSSQVRVS